MKNVFLNKDEDHVAKIKQALKDNDGYCPCAVIKSPDTKCMCADFRNMIRNNESGYCKCGLYKII